LGVGGSDFGVCSSQYGVCSMNEVLGLQLAFWGL